MSSNSWWNVFRNEASTATDGNPRVRRQRAFVADWSDETQLVGLFELDDSRACRAVPTCFNRGAAWRVMYRDSVRIARRAPMREQPQCARELRSGRGEAVVEPRRTLRVRRRDDHAFVLQVAEALRQHVRCE